MRFGVWIWSTREINRNKREEGLALGFEELKYLMTRKRKMYKKRRQTITPRPMEENRECAVLGGREEKPAFQEEGMDRRLNTPER